MSGVLALAGWGMQLSSRDSSHPAEPEPILSRDGADPELRYAVGHGHSVGFCLGWLYITRAKLRYEEVSPENLRAHTFEVSRSDIASFGQWKAPFGLGPKNWALLKLRNGTRISFLHVLPRNVDSEGIGAREESLPYTDLLEGYNHFDEVVARTRARDAQLQATVAPASAAVPPAAVPPAAVPPAAVPPAAVPPPEIRILEPAPGSETKEAVIRLRGEVRGMPELERVEVAGVAAQTHRLESGLIEFEAAVPLVLGPNTLKASAISKKGDREDLTVAVKRVLPPPLTVAEIEDALKKKLPATRIQSLITDYGVDFLLSDEVEKRLRAAGADSDLLLTIAKSKR